MSREYFRYATIQKSTTLVTNCQVSTRVALHNNDVRHLATSTIIP